MIKVIHYKIFKILLIFICFFIFNEYMEFYNNVYADISPESLNRKFRKDHVSIRSVSGRFYASIVLLFNENPHFVNLIQEDSITPEMIHKEGFHIQEYNNYLCSIKNTNIKKLAELMLKIYLHPKRFRAKDLFSIQEELVELNVVLRFSKTRNFGFEKIVLDYCIFGRKERINISHPLFNLKEIIFNIQPFIYYDEFSTSNSTFYFNMIYINTDEVFNDFLIAQKIINGKSVASMFFVGARINEDIKYCIAKAFKKSKKIKSEIFQMFIVHEVTHKVLNNQYNFFDQVTGEELALLSTIYLNPYLGLSVLFSYLDYNRINPHRIAAMNCIRYIANRTGKMELIDNPSGLKFFQSTEIKRLSKEHFYALLNNLK